MALSQTRVPNNIEARRNKFLKEIKTDYETYGNHKMNKVKSNNVMIIGRSRSGKTTIKELLLDPTMIPEELTLKCGTKEASIESFHISDINAILNIIDTPGLFERGSESSGIRTNEMILQAIEKCANMEITWFNVICFVIAITNGINDEDVRAIELFMKTLGDEISSNSCLIVTHCEGKNEEQRSNIKKELEEDKFFRQIKPYFKLGVFFSGSVNRDNYNNGHECIIDEYLAICKYRTQLIDLFTTNIKPFPITETKISEIRRAHEDKEFMSNQLQNAENLSKQQEHTNAHLQNMCQQQQRLIKDLEKKCKTNEQTMHHVQRQSMENELTIKDLTQQCKEYRRTIEDLRNKSMDEKRSTEVFQSKVKECECIIEELLPNFDPRQIKQLQKKYPNYFRFSPKTMMQFDQ